MEYKDYYQILGVAKDSTTRDINKAYRSLALKYHPDKVKEDQAAKKRFLDISEAKEVLCNPEKRKKYDQLGKDWQHYQETGSEKANYGGWDFSHKTDADSGKSYEFNFGSSGGTTDDFFESLFGEKYTGREGRFGTTAYRGQDVYADAEISLEEAYQGAKRSLLLNGQTLDINIKPGIADGKLLRFSGKGGPGLNEGPYGDLYIKIKCLPHPLFRRKGDDLYCTLPVGLYTALLGGKVVIQTMKGKIKVDIPQESENGKLLKLTGLGMPLHGKSGKYGNLYAEVAVQLPDKLTPEEKELFQELHKLRPLN
ncbi:MAG: J domain-containing protein [Fibrobacteria bacterium]|nr:J domain-containing protein [Fibrobacteria bacterium]